jgi:hypothetical protein
VLRLLGAAKSDEKSQKFHDRDPYKCCFFKKKLGKMVDLKVVDDED